VAATDPETRPGWRNRAVLREIDDRRVRRLWRVVLAMAVAAAPAAVYLVQQNECLKLRYEVNELREQRERLMQEQRRLSLEQARLESLARVETWAKRKHGMIQPGSANVVVVPAPEPEAGELVASAPNQATKSVR
jgi:cell division protein FtsL